MLRSFTAVIALLGVGMSLSHADSAVINKTETTSVSTTQQESSSVQPVADMKWTELRGKVQRIDLNAKVLQIKEKGTGKLVEVTVTQAVSVMDNSNHVISLGDLKQGQKVIIRNQQS